MSVYRRIASALAGAVLTTLGCSEPASSITGLPDLDREADAELFFPVLRNYAPKGPIEEIVVHRPVSDTLAVFACRKITRPNGATGIDYVLKRNLDLYGLSEAEVLDGCFDNFFARKIEVQVFEEGESKLFQLTSNEGLVAAILGHSSTRKQFVDMVGSDDLAVLVANPDLIRITARGSAFEAELPDISRDLETPEDAIDLSPHLLHWGVDEKLIESQL